MLTQTGLLVQHGLAICEHGIGMGVGELPIMAYTGSFRPKGVSFSGLRYERVGISLDEVYERASVLIAALAASLAVLKEKRTKFKNLRTRLRRT